MKFLATVDSRSQVHALWRLQSRKQALLYTILFTYNPVSRQYEAQELTNMQIKLARQNPTVIRMEVISGEEWKGPVPLEPPTHIFDTYTNPLSKLADQKDGKVPVQKTVSTPPVVEDRVPSKQKSKRQSAVKKRPRRVT